MNVIQFYASINNGDEDDDGQFYERLQNIVGECFRKDLVILAGNLDVEIGRDSTWYERIMWRYGLGK